VGASQYRERRRVPAAFTQLEIAQIEDMQHVKQELVWQLLDQPEVAVPSGSISGLLLVNPRLSGRQPRGVRRRWRGNLSGGARLGVAAGALPETGPHHGLVYQPRLRTSSAILSRRYSWYATWRAAPLGSAFSPPEKPAPPCSIGGCACTPFAARFNSPAFSLVVWGVGGGTRRNGTRRGEFLSHAKRLTVATGKFFSCRFWDSTLARGN